MPAPSPACTWCMAHHKGSETGWLPPEASKAMYHTVLTGNGEQGWAQNRSWTFARALFFLPWFITVTPVTACTPWQQEGLFVRAFPFLSFCDGRREAIRRLYWLKAGLLREAIIIRHVTELRATSVCHVTLAVLPNFYKPQCAPPQNRYSVTVCG